MNEIAKMAEFTLAYCSMYTYILFHSLYVSVKYTVCIDSAKKRSQTNKIAFEIK